LKMRSAASICLRMQKGTRQGLHIAATLAWRGTALRGIAAAAGTAFKVPVRDSSHGSGSGPCLGLEVDSSPEAKDHVVPDKFFEEPPLSEKQELLLNKILSEGQSVFFTGPAGSGKSRTLRELIRRAPESSTYVTALTGLASTHLIRGATLHRFAGIGLAKGSKEECLKRVQRSSKAKLKWKSAELLIVDEVSMMSKALFEKLEFVARKVRKNEQPFGGIVLCLCGDFFQLPPVSCSDASEDDSLFCFESERWARTLTGPSGQQNCFSLTEVFRQKEARLQALLSEVRHNAVTSQGIQALTELKRPLVVKEGIEPTKLFPTNRKADAHNMQRLASLPGGQGMEFSFTALDSIPAGQRMMPDALDAILTYPRRLELKVGAQVMLIKNLTSTLVNGSRGVVTSFCRVRGTQLPCVRFLCGTEQVIFSKKETVAGDGGQITRLQVPLRLSWALTIHKAQGMSIDFLEVDLRNAFEAGQAYVALSRARTLEGLRVLSFDPRRFWTNPKVAEFYKKHVQAL